MPVSEPEHPDALPAHHRLHWYVIERVLGQGGFGITYLARDTNLDQPVAIKEYLPVDVAARRDDAAVGSRTDGSRERFRWGLDRFIKEARMLARFDHPNIVRVHSVFELNSTAYMVMRFEAGETLSQLLESRGTLGEDELLRILLPVLDGLALVHTAGFIHRDIKPDNIHIRADGTPVLLDFGSARTAIGKARTLTILVAPGYSPFEQYYGSAESQGPWTDIYGLGATCYRAIAGRAPLDAIARSKGILGGGRDAIVPAAVVGAGRYSGRLLAAIDHALAFSEKDRPQTIAEWRKELVGNGGTPVAAPRAEARVAGPRTMTAPPLEGVRPVAAALQLDGARAVAADAPPDPTPAKPGPLLWSIAGAAGTALLIGLVLHFTRNAEEPPPKPPATADADASKALQDKIAALEKQVQEQARKRAEEERERREEAERRQRQAAEAERARAELARAELARREAEERTRAAAKQAEEEASRRAELARREAEERVRAAAAKQAEEEASRRAEAARVANAAARSKPEPPPPAGAAKSPAPTATQVLAQSDEAAARGNFGDAAALLKPLVERSDPAAQFRLSQLYLDGRGVEQDQKEGVRLLEGAATQGHRDARLMLGGMYATGRSVRQNANVAYIWYGAAACAGSARARAEQESIKARLQPAEIQQAEKLIADLCKRG
jgi:serine/threonine protein kinase